VLVIGLNAFHVCGGILALWAVVLTAIGLTQHGFPTTKSQERAVIGLSVLLVAAAIGSAIYTGATEEHGGGHKSGGHEAGALVRPF
jgi:formate-dependent nitrite reductase membrane component NrfD